MIDGFWVSNQLLSGNGLAGREAAKQACIACLRAHFPDAFPDARQIPTG